LKKKFAHFTSVAKFRPVLGEASYFRPHRRTFDSVSAPAPGNLPSLGEKERQIPRGLARAGSWAQLELSDALHANEGRVGFNENTSF